MNKPLHLPLGVIWLIALSCSALADTAELQPLTVYGQRLETDDPIQTPGSDTVIHLADLPSIPSGSVANLLESRAGLPPFSFFGDPGLGSPIIRGFSENSSSRTLILLDGIPISSPDLSASPWFQFPVSGLSKVAVLRGSRTVRYGSGALGGVISLESQASRDDFTGSLETIFGSFASETYRAHLSLPLHDWSLGLNLDLNSRSGYRDHSGFDSTAWSTFLLSPENDTFEGRWFLSGSTLEFDNPGSLSRRQFFDNPRQSFVARFNLEDQFINENENLRAAQKLTWNLSKDLTLSSNTSWRNRLRESNFGAGSHSDQDLKTWFQEVVLSQKKDLFSWELGLRAQLDDLRNTRFADQARNDTVGIANLDRESIGAFALARYEFNNQFALTGGAGWDHWTLAAETEDFLSPADPTLNFARQRSGQGLSAEIALNYDLSENLNTWLRYDRIYRFPVADEIAAYQGFILAEPFNADLDAERGHALELGWNYQKSSWKYEGALFSQWLEGEIGFDFRQNLNVNFADTHRLGLENRLSYQSDRWDLSLNHSLTYARYRSGEFRGNDVPLVPRHIFSARADWQASDKFSLGLEALALDSSPEGNDFANRQEKLPGRWLFNGELGWQLNEDLRLNLRADNIFDKRYATLKFQGQWYPGNGRKISLGLNYQF